MKRFRLAVLTGILCLGVTACSSEEAQEAVRNVDDTIRKVTSIRDKLKQELNTL